MASYRAEEADDFLDKVDDIQKRVDAILKGDVDAMAEEERFLEEVKLEGVKKEIA